MIGREHRGDDNGKNYGGSDGVRFQTEWLLVEDTVKEFFAHLIGVLKAYIPHVYEIKLSDRVGRYVEGVFLINPVANPVCPDEFKDVVMEVVDFLSNIHAKGEHDVTCTFPESHKCKVHHLSFDPKFVLVDIIEVNHPCSATALRKRKIDRVLHLENVVLYVFSKAKASAAYNQFSNTISMSILKHGTVPKNSKCEALQDGKRIPGGIREGFPVLPLDKLFEFESCPPLYPNIKRFCQSRDGCAAQFQGKGDFFEWQTMAARHGIPCKDRRKGSMHGKDVIDGDGSVVSGMVNGSFSDDYGEGTQNLVRHLAYK